MNVEVCEMCRPDTHAFHAKVLEEKQKAREKIK
jgi:hypothetical protein